MSDLVSCKTKGNEFFKVQKYPDAIEWYSKAVAAGGEPADLGAIYSNRAASYIALKKFDEAIKDSELCIQARPDWVKGYFRKAAALEAQNLPDEAEKAFSLALKCEPANGDIQDRINNVRTIIKSRNDKATPGTCTSSPQAKLIGNSLFKLGNYERAITFYTRAVELAKDGDTDKATYFVNRALCHAQTSSHKLVIGDCEEALLLDPKNAKALIRRALAFEGLEKWQKGLDDYMTVCAMGLNSQQATEGRMRCQRALRSL